MKAIEILKKLVSFNTINDFENTEIIDWIENFLCQYSFVCKKIVDKNGKMNLIAESVKKPVLAFSGHLDTVPYGSNWDTNPFELTIKDNLAYGLGVCDMKGGISSFLKAVTTVDQSKLKKGIKLYFTFDEETNFNGIKLLQNEVFPPTIIIAEPTDLIPVTASKGCIDIEVIFSGTSVHSSLVAQNKNAIFEANKFITELLQLSYELKMQENSLFTPSFATINIGKIKGGNATNTVADECALCIDIRTVYQKQNAEIIEKINKILKIYDAKMKVNIDIAPKINKNAQMIEIIEKITKNSNKSVNYATEASFMNSDAIVLGVGPITSHQANEHIDINKLEKLVKIYGDIIEACCF